jgi:hypothetical protein
MYSLFTIKNNTNTEVSSTKFNSFTMQSVKMFFHTLTLCGSLKDDTNIETDINYIDIFTHNDFRVRTKVYDKGQRHFTI